MTNTSSGHKRTWDGVEVESHKRSRDREPRDWRDVHLRSPNNKSPISRRDSIDKRSGGDHSGRGIDHRWSDNGRDKVRRDGDRARDRDHHGRRDGLHKDDPAHRSSASARVHRSPRQSNGHSHPVKDDSEKEEGEISPRHSPGPSLPPSSHVSPQPPPTPTDPPRQSEMDLDLPLSPPPVESRLAARRAKRLAIIAKYAGIASSPSLGPSSAVQPPQPISSISDPISQAYSVADTAGIIQEIDMTLTS